MVLRTFLFTGSPFPRSSVAGNLGKKPTFLIKNFYVGITGNTFPPNFRITCPQTAPGVPAVTSHFIGVRNQSINELSMACARSFTLEIKLSSDRRIAKQRDNRLQWTNKYIKYCFDELFSPAFHQRVNLTTGLRDSLGTPLRRYIKLIHFNLRL